MTNPHTFVSRETYIPTHAKIIPIYSMAHIIVYMGGFTPHGDIPTLWVSHHVHNMDMAHIVAWYMQ